MVSAIEAELTKATKIKPKKGEPRPEFLIRVWDAACDVEDSVWNKLSFPAAEWVNEITLKNREHTKKPNGKFVPVDFPDVAVAAEPLDETLEAAEAEAKVEKDLEKFKKTKAKANPKPAPEPEEDEDEEEEPTKDGSDEIGDEGEEDEDVLRTKAPEPQPEPKHEPEVELARASTKKAPPQPEYDEPRLNVQGMVRHMMIETPHIPLDVLHQKIEEEIGETVSLTTVRASKSWFKAALRDLERKDCLSKAFKAKLKASSA